MIIENNNQNLPEKHFTASALITNNEGDKVLLVKHKKLGVWLYPGGHIERYETPEETVIREAKEETGLSVEIIGQRDSSLSDQKNDVLALYNPYVILCERIMGSNGCHYHLDMVYLCKVREGQLLHNPQESEDINFFGLKDIDNLKLFPNFKKLLEKFLGKN